MNRPLYALDVSMAVRERPTGQARFVCELLKSLDASGRADDFVVVVRKGANLTRLPPLKNLRLVTFGFGREILWHQTFFPLYAALHHLTPISLANTAPLLNVGIVGILDITYKTCSSSYKSFHGRLSMLWHRFQYAWCARFAKRVITISEFSKTEFARVYNYPLTRIFVVPCGWEHVREGDEDEGVFARFPTIRKDDYYFVLGTNFEFKNIALAIRTAVRYPSTQWVITGSALKTSSFSAEAHANIIWTGYLSNAEVKSLTKHAKALFFPSLNEGFGLPPLEALALGTSAIVSRASCMPGLLGNTVHWIDDPCAEIPPDPDELLKTPVEQPNVVLEKYSWSKLGAAFLAALDARRIAAFVPRPLGTGGVGICLRNYLRQLDHTRYQLDFFVPEVAPQEVVDEIAATGGHVYSIPGLGNLIKYLWTVTRLLRRGHYDIVHANMNTLSVFPLFAARLVRIPLRISHAHSGSHARERLRHFIKRVLSLFSHFFVTRFVMCSRLAGEFQFGRRTVAAGRVTLLPNAIDLSHYRFDEEARTAVRHEFGLEGKFVVGNVGRFVTQKNPLFLLQIFAEIAKKRADAVLFLLGEGPLREEIESFICANGLEGRVVLAGQRLDSWHYYNAFDIFCLPSLYEGLALVLIEAQANGLRCVASTEIPAEANVADGITFVPLAQDASHWAETTLAVAGDATHRTTDSDAMCAAIRRSGYDILSAASHLVDVYR